KATPHQSQPSHQGSKSRHLFQHRISHTLIFIALFPTFLPKGRRATQTEPHIIDAFNATKHILYKKFDFVWMTFVKVFATRHSLDALAKMTAFTHLGCVL